MTSLQKLAFEQANKCFLCKKKVAKNKQSVEHILAQSLGGKSNEGNTIMVCKKVNQMLGNRSLKEKLRIILEHDGKFSCPDKNG